MRSTSAMYTDEQAAAVRSAVERIRQADAELAAAEIARERALADAGEVAREVAAAQRSSVRVHDMVLRSIAAEIGAATGVSDRTIQRQIGHAVTLVEDFPVSTAAREAGAISARHLRDIVDAAAPLPPQARGEFDILAAAEATTDTPARVRPRLLRLASRLHPRTPTERHRTAREDRRVRVIPLSDGMSELIAVLPTTLAVAVQDRLVQMGRAIADVERRSPSDRRTPPGGGDAGGDGGDHASGNGPGRGTVSGRAVADVPGEGGGGSSRGGADGGADSRTADQIQADVLTDLLLTGAPMADPVAAGGGSTLGAIRAKVQITVPAMTILDPRRERDDPAELVGHGPIDGETARRLAEATLVPWDRVITHPITGAVLFADTYERTAAIDRHIRARDRHCRWPGCALPTVRCEIDHTVDWARGGPTASTNLSCLCQRHHSMKQFAGWSVRQVDGGVLEWTSPLGAVYVDEPAAYPPAVRFIESETEGQGEPDENRRRGESGENRAPGGPGENHDRGGPGGNHDRGEPRAHRDQNNLGRGSPPSTDAPF
ncbi:HNH endonuclease signature motif containing protein [Microbacterium sp. LMI1-1-1.1]|uniref:HNH endonuclease signature motif containing protein n=1 Tax=Microbacterium sp. LMI1-1-1.1 TaxID=3135223 RepID=UPI0034653F30